jgi:predicted methyltransferase
MIRRTLFLAAMLAAVALPAASQTISPAIAAAVSDPGRPEADTKRDGDRKPAESIAFAGIKPGDSVLELIAAGGYYTRILSKLVGPNGHVYATVPDAMVKARPTAADGLNALAAQYPNVTLLVQPTGAPSAPAPVDVVWTSLNYHDLHNPGPFGAGDIDGFNKAAFAALKRGGTFLVIDHAAAPGSGFSATGTLHRADPDAVKAEILKAGFTFAGQSDILHRATDDHTARSTDTDDQFIFKFRKP